MNERRGIQWSSIILQGVIQVVIGLGIVMSMFYKLESRVMVTESSLQWTQQEMKNLKIDVLANEGDIKAGVDKLNRRFDCFTQPHLCDRRP